MTNIERIRARTRFACRRIAVGDTRVPTKMTLDEMTEFVRGRHGCDACIYSSMANSVKAAFCVSELCDEGIRKWLEAEAQNG